MYSYSIENNFPFPLALMMEHNFNNTLSIHNFLYKIRLMTALLEGILLRHPKIIWSS